jgi:hypothetical protein
MNPHRFRFGLQRIRDYHRGRAVPKAEIRRHVRSPANGTPRPILQESLFFGKSK